MNLFGLDVSLTSTGLFKCDVNAKDLGEGITRAFVTAPKDGQVWERMWVTISTIYKMVAEGDIVFVEDYSFNSKGSQFTLAEITGTLKLLIWRKTGIYPFVVAPTMVKKWIVGDGRAQKDDIKLALYKKYKREFATSDEADAFAIGDFGFHVIGRQLRALTKVELTTIEKFQKGVLKSYGETLLSIQKQLTK